MRYYVQFNAGLEGLVKRSLDTDLKEIRIVFKDDSSMIFDSGSESRKVAALTYLKNAFVVLAETNRASLAVAVPRLLSQLKRPEVAHLAPRRRGFRVMTSIDGGLVALPHETRSRVERSIASRTGSWVQARGSGEEYWIIGRRNLDLLLLGLRLPKSKASATPRGALGAELSKMLVLASQPRPKDVFLDPFAGSGSIVLARLDFPARRIIYSDTGYRHLRASLRPELARAGRVEFFDEDARVLPSVSNGSVDVVVTDPPWGEYQDLDCPFAEFAGDVSASLDRVLHSQTGHFVILIARRRAQVLSNSLVTAGFTLEVTYEVLVNGHPATVLVGGRGKSVAP